MPGGLSPIKFEQKKKRHNPVIPFVVETENSYQFRNINHLGRLVGVDFDKAPMFDCAQESAESWTYLLKKSRKILAPINLIFSVISEFYDIREYRNKVFNSFRDNFIENLSSGEVITSTRIKETHRRDTSTVSTDIYHYFGDEEIKVNGRGAKIAQFEGLTDLIIENVFAEDQLAGAIFGTESIERIVNVFQWFSGQQIGRRFGRFNKSSKSYLVSLTDTQKERDGMLLLGKDEHHFYVKNSGINESTGCAYGVVLQDEQC
ncbi:hypothetical protein HY837_00700 [archaeon]|nr:hypothetical protein [archaeon]